jgi:hypothetical protein
MYDFPPGALTATLHATTPSSSLTSARLIMQSTFMGRHILPSNYIGHQPVQNLKMAFNVMHWTRHCGKKKSQPRTQGYG